MVNAAFTGGGTGGHIFPGLAVAAELKNRFTGRDFRLFWIGSCAGIDRGIVEEAGVEFFGVPSGKLRRYFSLRTILDFFRIIASFFAARKILKREKANVLFSKGGFVSVPPCAAAASLGIPVYTHESDFSPGLATRLNARYVSRTGGKIFTAYEETGSFFPRKARSFVTVSGNPIRAVFRGANAAQGREFLKAGEKERILLVLGGSQGSHEINALIRAVLHDLSEIYTVVHQSGPGQSWDLPNTEKYKTFPFIKEEMPHVLAAAEIVAGRSGAGIWEWAALGKPMVLIPLSGSGTRGDQMENARFFEKAGAAIVIMGDVDKPQELVRAVRTLACDAQKRQAMADASRKIGKLDSADIIAGAIENDLGQRTKNIGSAKIKSFK
ncbi:MAG: undecaprenyldiphospho-muramoylpentapeptide beta-N-acetylglucosaminyltransferase [Treponema sp.]|jgi:UDP-N-acetylglucosamine--N-acetylmuramyl-(pentapeptide) pyrophosphoryl-undecaprenol N-acetylglucosamine transferase|nr:undecaprenyldiphospho-muramoylpentapeptide beta-N-acetylglucosaminyltransferase [Treponema sp.]